TEPAAVSACCPLRPIRHGRRRSTPSWSPTRRRWGWQRCGASSPRSPRISRCRPRRPTNQQLDRIGRGGGDCARPISSPEPEDMAPRELIGMIAFFSEALNGDEIFALASGAERRTFDAGEALLREGEPGESLFVIESGQVSVKI